MVNRLFFPLCIILSALILNRISYNEESVAMRRIEHQIREKAELKEDIAKNCGELLGKGGTVEEKFFIKQFAHRAIEGVQACGISAVHEKATRFGLINRWNFNILIQNETFQKTQNFSTTTPSPLVLLPLIIFFLGLVFEFTAWNTGWAIAGFLFFVTGLNLKLALVEMIRSTGVILSSDFSYWGLITIGAWLVLITHRKEPVPYTETKKWQERASYWAPYWRMFVGLWNPTVFAIGSHCFYSAKQGWLQFTRVLELQTILVCLSLYLLFVDGNSSVSFVAKNFLLPRYLTFALLLFFVLSNPKLPQVKEWKQISLLDLRRWGLAVLAVEILAFKWRWLGQTPTVFRVGTTLFLAEFFVFNAIYSRDLFTKFFKIVSLVTLTQLVVTATSDFGVREMIMGILSPQIHPNALAFFTFLSAFTLSLISGSFSFAFFTLAPLVGGEGQSILVKAALLDGILAGILVSPLSPLNFYPAILHHQPNAKVVSYRFRQLLAPILLGAFIYALSHLSSVGILQPVTFVFLCLIVIAFKLRQNAWQIPLLDSV